VPRSHSTGRGADGRAIFTTPTWHGGCSSHLTTGSLSLERKNATTVQEIRGVEFCAVLNEVGDRALAVALDCAKRHPVRLDIFFVPASPHEPHSSRGRQVERVLLSRRDPIELDAMDLVAQVECRPGGLLMG
jgi:hypothetical protein